MDESKFRRYSEISLLIVGVIGISFLIIPGGHADFNFSALTIIAVFELGSYLGDI